MKKTIREAWAEGKSRLAEVSSSASLDAQVLLAHTIAVENRAYLFAHPEQQLSPAEIEQYNAYIKRRAHGEPVAYILGYRDWYDRRILVTPDVLIPRPETELLVEEAIAYLKQIPNAIAVDICTGSGAIAVTIKANVPHATVHATDISAAALAVAQRNAQEAAVDIHFHEGNLLEPLINQGIRVNLLASNPPYIDSDELQQLDVSKYEPLLALDGGPKGLILIEQLLQRMPEVCLPGALVLMEIGADQGGTVLEMAQHYLNPAEAAIVPDYAGLDRFLRARLPG